MTQDTVSLDEKPPSKSSRWAAWSWIPTLYFAEGLPNVAVTKMATVMYQNLGVSIERTTAYANDLLWPWVLKPLWSPLVDLLGTQRRWIVAMQLAIAVSMMGVALAAPTEHFLMLTLAALWLMAIASATHDIAADGFYMSGMSERDQAWFVGIRSSFYRLAMMVGEGVLVGMAGYLMTTGRYDAAAAWSWIFATTGMFFASVAIYHHFILPRPVLASSSQEKSVSTLGRDFIETFVSFFQKPGIAVALAYILLYRFSEAQLGAVKPFFLLGDRADGGLALSNELYGLLNGILGICLLLFGGIVGGMIVSRDGLKRWLFPMALAINVPNVAYAYLAIYQPESMWLIGTAVAIEQLGYGFGFAGYMLYMLQLSQGKHQTAHYALCTGFMALGMMIPGRFSGQLKVFLGGYENFFFWVLIATIPSLIITLVAPLREESASAEEES